MTEFRGFDGLTGDAQRAEMKGWGATAFPVVEPILYRQDEEGLGNVRFLVCRRMKGALSDAKPPACTTSNPGGHHVLPGTDDTPVDAVVRSVGKKLGYAITRDAPELIGTFGPALNKADMAIESTTIRLTIRDEPAEPEVPFIAHVFKVRIRSVPIWTPDESLKEVGWFTLREIVARYGQSGTHIYFQFLFQCARHFIHGRNADWDFPRWQPGTYDLEI